MHFFSSLGALVLSVTLISNNIKQVNANNDCKMAYTSDGGYYSFCGQGEKAITYNNIAGSNSYKDVINIENCQASTVDKPFSGSMTPFDEDISVHVRGPIILKKFAAYYPSGNSKRDFTIDDVINMFKRNGTDFVPRIVATKNLNQDTIDKRDESQYEVEEVVVVEEIVRVKYVTEPKNTITDAGNLKTVMTSLTSVVSDTNKSKTSAKESSSAQSSTKSEQATSTVSSKKSEQSTSAQSSKNSEGSTSSQSSKKSEQSTSAQSSKNSEGSTSSQSSKKSEGSSSAQSSTKSEGSSSAQSSTKSEQATSTQSSKKSEQATSTQSSTKSEQATSTPKSTVTLSKQNTQQPSVSHGSAVPAQKRTTKQSNTVEPTATTTTPTSESITRGTAVPVQASTCQSGGSGWVRSSFYDSEKKLADNIIFGGNYGGTGSGFFSAECVGNSLSYLSKDGLTGASSPQVLDYTKFPNNKEFSIFTAEPCDESCGYYDSRVPGLKGFAGKNKLLMFEFAMPEDDTPTSINENMPAIWLLNGRIPRIGQYAGLSCWKSGCGEFDIFEVLELEKDKMISCIHGKQNGCAPQYFKRPTGENFMIGGVIFSEASQSATIFTLDNFDWGCNVDESEYSGITGTQFALP